MDWELKDVDNLQQIADLIDTGTENSENSRALVVFNLTPQALNGCARYRVSMPWKIDHIMPPIVVSNMDGFPIDSEVSHLSQNPLAMAREGYMQIEFDLLFRVTTINPISWQTYIAAFSDCTVETATEYLSPIIAALQVFETNRHNGIYPHTGTLAMLGESLG